MGLIDRAMNIARVGPVIVPLGHPALSAHMRKVLSGGGDYETQEARAAVALFHDGDTVLELGSGVGVTSAIIAKACKRSRIVTIEANPDLIDLIGKVHARNRVAHIEVRHGAAVCGHASETITFNLRQNFWASSLLSVLPPHRTVNVPALEWDDLLTEIRPAAVIMDIEGGELEILERRNMGTVKRLVIELHPELYGADGLARCRSALDNAGFIADPISSHNVLALRR